MSHRTPCRDRPGQNAWLANTNSHVAADAIGAKSAHGRVDATARGGAGGGGASQSSCNSLAIPESFSRRLGWAGPLGGLEDSPLGNTPRTSECSRKIQTPACMVCRMSAPKTWAKSIIRQVCYPVSSDFSLFSSRKTASMYAHLF